MEAAKPVKHGGKYCVAGAGNNKSCTNTSYTPGISIHLFSSDPKIKEEWVSFVQKLRKDFNSVSVKKNTALCSAHFEESCFSRPVLGLDDVKFKRVFLRGSVPSIYTVAPETTFTAREKRKVSHACMRIVQMFYDIKTSSGYRQQRNCLFNVCSCLISVFHFFCIFHLNFWLFIIFYYNTFIKINVYLFDYERCHAQNMGVVEKLVNLQKA